MFEASVDGQPYDPELFGQYYRPAGLQYNGPTASSAPSPQPAAAPVAETVTDTGWQEPAPVAAPAPVSAPAESEVSTKTSDILAMIKQRKGA